jgi:GT2 family glycosyltransferase
MLAVVIPTRDKASRLRLCLYVLAEALERAVEPWSTVVVDDGSRDRTPEVLREARSRLADRLTTLRFDAPQGRSAARNAGAKRARARRLLFLDDDILVEPEVLTRHAAAGEEEASPVLARATIFHLPWLRHLEDPAQPGPEVPSRLAERARRLTLGLTDEVRALARRSAFEADLHHLLALREGQPGGRWPAATGGNLSLDRDFFLSLGGFDPAMGLRWGVEDLELGLRAEQAGARIVHLSDVRVYHMDHPAAGRAGDHEANLRYFAAKHGAALGARLSAYFAGTGELARVVAP